jgi:hypothetical protein
MPHELCHIEGALFCCGWVLLGKKGLLVAAVYLLGRHPSLGSYKDHPARDRSIHASSGFVSTVDEGSSRGLLSRTQPI